MRKLTAFLLPPAPFLIACFSWSGAPRSGATETPVALTLALLVEPKLEFVVAWRRRDEALKADGSAEPVVDVKKAIFDVADADDEEEDACRSNDRRSTIFALVRRSVNGARE